jgi:DNA polymerase-3 subunit alpha
MRSLLRSMQPDRFDDISRCWRCTARDRWGANAHNDYADRKTGASRSCRSTRAGRTAQRRSRETLRPDRLPGAGHGIAQKLAGYTLGKADLLRRAMGKKKTEILDKEYAGLRRG